MIATPLRALLFLAGGLIAAAAVAVVAGVFEPGVPGAQVAATGAPPQAAGNNGGEGATRARAPADRSAAGAAPRSGVADGAQITEDAPKEVARGPSVALTEDGAAAPDPGGQAPAASRVAGPDSGGQQAAIPQPAPADETASRDGLSARNSAEEVAADRAPAFDLLRVEGDGSVVIAGTAAPDARVEVLAGGRTVGETTAGPGGDFAAVLDAPLEPGDYQIELRATVPGSAPVTSRQTAVVSVPEDPDGQVLALVEEAGRPVTILTRPSPQGQGTQPEEIHEADPATAAAAAPPQQGASGAKESGADAQAEETATAAEDAPERDGGSETAAATPPPAGPDASAVAGPDGGELPAGADAPAVAVEAVEIEGRQIFVAGAAPAGSTVRVYVGAMELGDAVATPQGRFLVEAVRDLPVGEYIVRADVIGRDGRVLARAAVPFEREPGQSVAAVAGGPEAEAADQAAAAAGEQVAAAEDQAADDERSGVAAGENAGTAAAASSGRQAAGAGGQEQAGAGAEAASDVARTPPGGPTEAAPGGAGEEAAARGPGGQPVGSEQERAREGTQASAASRPEADAPAAVGAAEDDAASQGTAAAADGAGEAPMARDASSAGEAPAGDQTPATDGAVAGHALAAVSETPAANNSVEPLPSDGSGSEAASTPADQADTAPDQPPSAEVEAPASGDADGTASATGSEAGTGPSPPSTEAAGGLPVAAATDAGSEAARPDAAAAAEAPAALAGQEQADAAMPEQAAPEQEQSAAQKAASAQEQSAAPSTGAGPAAEGADRAPAEASAGSQQPADVAAASSGSQPLPAAEDQAPPAGETALTAPKLKRATGAVIIRRGDTLWRISRRVYGRGVRYLTIYLANQQQIADPDLIWPGQVFKVPGQTPAGETADMTKIGEQATTTAE